MLYDTVLQLCYIILCYTVVSYTVCSGIVSYCIVLYFLSFYCPPNSIRFGDLSWKKGTRRAGWVARGSELGPADRMGGALI